MEGYHKSVLLRQVLENLNELSGEDWVIDATLGDGGYSVEVLKKGGKVLGIDVDTQALKRTRLRFENEGFREEEDFELVLGNFRDLKQLISNKTGKNYKTIIFDLGVSSLQLDSPERGFSFGKDGPLDMRMDSSLAVDASDLINGLTKGELNELFSKLGEEQHSKRFAEAVERARQIKKIETTKELADVIERAYKGPRGKIHPATKVFQALRIAINDELNSLREVLPQALEVISTGGRVLVISFHSLEDRIAKRVFNDWEEQGLGQMITKKPLEADEDEVVKNPRARSAKLRVFQKSI